VLATVAKFKLILVLTATILGKLLLPMGADIVAEVENPDAVDPETPDAALPPM
jgi:hypothetical protein